MERIKQAIERAKAQGAGLGQVRQEWRRPMPLGNEQHVPVAPLATMHVDEAHLENMRVVAHRASNPMSAGFDVLRTTVLQEMDAHDWQTILVSSPTPACGKTVLSINLALSIARLPDRAVVLIDLDMRRPQVASYLGLKRSHGLHEALTGALPLTECMIHLNVAGPSLNVLPNQGAISNPAEVIGSKEMGGLLEQIKGMGRKPVIVIDTSPMLVCDDVLALLPRIDCVVLAVAERLSTPEEVASCERQLKSSNYLGVVLTKSQERTGTYYYG
jgi:protein-tyrosine kinase